MSIGERDAPSPELRAVEGGPSTTTRVHPVSGWRGVHLSPRLWALQGPTRRPSALSRGVPSWQGLGPLSTWRENVRLSILLGSHMFQVGGGRQTVLPHPVPTAFGRWMALFSVPQAFKPKLGQPTQPCVVGSSWER